MKNFLLRNWIEGLTFLSGFLNTALIQIYAVSVSHHTGNMTRLALSLGSFDFHSARFLFLSVLCFFAGSFVAGFLFYDRVFHLQKTYGLFLIGFSVVFLSLFFLDFWQDLCVFITTFILGMQNGMFIFFDGILVRTTHVTGYLTDAATSFGMAMRGKPNEMRRTLFYIKSMCFFIFGGIFSVLAAKDYVFLIASCSYLFLGVVYFILRRTKENL
ncbi:MAG: YoaK family protein [Treponema phagedenis]|nr:YoaK family protein [Treponema phagedenis]NVP24439.1 DUF1275 domain-containing protein [Treponema phagedenis]QKS92688.1 DUF1275 domain-containing protein [Treponema phagedenis]